MSLSSEKDCTKIYHNTTKTSKCGFALVKLEAGKDLKKIVSRLTQTTEKNFTQKLDEWYEKYKDF